MKALAQIAKNIENKFIFIPLEFGLKIQNYIKVYIYIYIYFKNNYIFTCNLLHFF